MLKHTDEDLMNPLLLLPLFKASDDNCVQTNVNFFLP